ncbi:MAG: hypothetical protein G01um101416_617 [Microgenomates group bacterium Gr01-1014_16]|nr:MAG: hypothetical protein G01um101416_617 [Microgenomates group bacterium Gr01-1014_16]
MKHICGQCTKTFISEIAYLGHLCQTTGYTPLQSHPAAQPKGGLKLTEKNLVAAVRSIRRAKKHV